MKFDIEQIRQLADLALEKNLAELTVEDGEQAITIKMPSANVVVAPHAVAAHPVAAAPAQAAAPADKAPAKEAAPAAADDGKYHKVTSPMVGTFYSAPSPESPPYVSVGASVSKGQTLCIIEAMKMMNELESEVSGKVVKVLVENGTPVEFGTPLFLVDA